MEAIAGFLGVFFIFGGFWFWVLFLSFFGGLVALADHEENFWAGVIVLGFFAGVYYFNNLIIDWSLVPWVILGYLVLGIVMSFIKWITFLKLRASKYYDLKMEWAEGTRYEAQVSKTTNMKEILDDGDYHSFVSFLKREDFITRRETRILPVWKDKYKKLVSWALWWPAVIFWSVLNDHIRGAFNYSVRAMRGWYEALAKKVFSAVGVDAKDNNQLY